MIQDLEVTIMTLYMVCPYCNKEETNVVDSRKTMKVTLLEEEESALSVNYASLRMKKLKLV